MERSAAHVRVEDIEDALVEVGEIKAARIVATPEGVIQEIHVLALPTKAPKQLVRDIESTIMARFGVAIDHKKISIAQLGRDSAGAREAVQEEKPPVARTRPRLHSINATVGGLEATVSVTLETDEKTFVGTANGPASQTGRLRLVALATLDAVGQAIGDEIGLALEDVAVCHLGRERVAVACIAWVTPFGEQSFSGSALVRQNENDSIVRATLDAINRRMGWLKTT